MPCSGDSGEKALFVLYLGYLSEQELGHLSAQVDRTARHGERDYVLLACSTILARDVQELLA